MSVEALFPLCLLKITTNQCEPEVRPEPGQETTLSFSLTTPPAEARESLCGYLRQGRRSTDSPINELWFFIWLPDASRKAQFSSIFVVFETAE